MILQNNKIQMKKKITIFSNKINIQINKKSNNLIYNIKNFHEIKKCNYFCQIQMTLIKKVSISEKKLKYDIKN